MYRERNPATIMRRPCNSHLTTGAHLCGDAVVAKIAGPRLRAKDSGKIRYKSLSKQNKVRGIVSIVEG